MSVKATQSDSDQSVQKRSASYVVVKTMADTTWRMFAPVFGCTFLGYWLDGVFHTRPTLVFTGIVVGAVAAAGLVVHQYRQVKKESEQQ